MCFHHADVNGGKYTWTQTSYGGEEVLLNTPRWCSFDGVICLMARALEPTFVSNRRELTVWYGNSVANCPCEYQRDSPSSPAEMSCQCTVTMTVD
jgi:hypothetical protein